MKNMKRNLLLTLLLTTCIFLSSFAQPGAIDLTFNPTDAGFGIGDGADNTVNAIAIQSDGKIIIGGNFTSYNGTARNYIARLDSGGRLDTGFNPGIIAGTTSLSVNAVAVQSDGKILIGGNFTSCNGTTKRGIARLNSDGSLDMSFINPGIGTNGPVSSIALQSDGKIIIGGYFTYYNVTARNGIARLNSDGSLDTGFDPGTGVSGGSYTSVRSIALQNDEKILIGGDFAIFNGTGRNCIARLDSTGSLDTGFDPGTGVSGSIYPAVNSVVLQNDGTILTGGGFDSYNGIARSGIVHLNSDGSLDTSFASLGAFSLVSSIALQSDGKILIGGQIYTTTTNHLCRLNSDGSLDTGFKPGLVAGAGIYSINSVAVQSNGKILTGGYFTSYNGITENYLARVDHDGSIDTSFNPGTGANNSVNSIAVQSDGKILTGGIFTFYNGTGRNRIARLNTDGSLDTGFDPGTGTTGGSNPSVNSVVLQSDGKILIGGGFTKYNGTGRNHIARINTNGSLDAGFNPGSGANSNINSVAVQSDGKILIGGAFTTFSFTGRNRIARLNTSGSLDAGFNPGSGANSSVNSVALQSDGKILIGGTFTSYYGIARNGIARINADGSLDTGFDPGSGANSSINSIAVQSDGKILIGGSFTSYNGAGRNRIARLDSTGSLDTGFDPGSGTDLDVNSITIQSDGKILIGGTFTSFNGTARSGIARINADGSLDTGFDPGTGTGGDYPSISFIALQSDGNILTGGGFTSYNGTGRNRIARILSGSLTTSLLSSSVFPASTAFPNPFTTHTIVKTGSTLSGNAVISILDVNGNEIRSITDVHSDEIKIERGALTSGIYFYRIFDNGKFIGNGKLVVQE